jgi:hypothetical protein
MHAQSMDEAMHAAELATLAMACRAVLGRAASAEPEVVSLRLTCALESPGVSVIEIELIERGGMAFGGFGL